MRVRRRVLESIVAHARREQPRECCGLLIGADDEVFEAVAAANVASDPLREYEVSPIDHFAEIRRCRASTTHGRPREVVGGYHSHPRSAPEPSPTDLERAFEGFLYVIAGAIGDGMGVRAYRLIGDRFESVELEIV